LGLAAGAVLKKPLAWVVLSKWPYPGQLKTRIAKTTNPCFAADLSWAMLDDTLTQLEKLEARMEVYLAMPSPPTWLRAYRQATLIDQGQGNLGDRLESITQQMFQTHSQLVLMGSDSPHIPQKTIVQTLESLNNQSSVLGLASDGGYYLQGFPHKPVDLFIDMPWSTDSVGAIMQKRQAAQFEKVDPLPPLTDIDQWQHTANLHDSHITPNSAVLLSRQTLQP
jgi:rSAM/selenodomain-associated transferase 1